jgi:hypothetical protein
MAVSGRERAYDAIARISINAKRIHERELGSSCAETRRTPKSYKVRKAVNHDSPSCVLGIVLRMSVKVANPMISPP